MEGCSERQNVYPNYFSFFFFFFGVEVYLSFFWGGGYVTQIMYEF